MLHWGETCIFTQGVNHPQEVCALNEHVQRPVVLRRAQTKGRDDTVGMLLAANDTARNTAKEGNCQVICPLCLRLSPCSKSHSMSWYVDRLLNNNIDNTHGNAKHATNDTDALKRCYALLHFFGMINDVDSLVVARRRQCK